MTYQKIVLSLGLMGLMGCVSIAVEGPWLATGIKIGEVTQTEAIVWVRLTENPERVGNDAPMPEVRYEEADTGDRVEVSDRPDLTPVVLFPEGYDINTIQGATPGSEGKARVRYRSAGEGDWIQLDWQAVDPAASFSAQLDLSDLSPGQVYEIVVEASPVGSDRVSAFMEGSFRTAPAATTPSDVNFIVTTGTSYPDHLYLNVVGGFLEGSVTRINDEPALVFRHYDPDGNLLNEFTVDAE